jgi:hypothetical protein
MDRTVYPNAVIVITKPIMVAATVIIIIILLTEQPITVWLEANAINVIKV